MYYIELSGTEIVTTKSLAATVHHWPAPPIFSFHNCLLLLQETEIGLKLRLLLFIPEVWPFDH